MAKTLFKRKTIQQLYRRRKKKKRNGKERLKKISEMKAINEISV